MRSNEVTLGEAIDQFIDRNGLRDNYDSSRLLNQWAEVIGKLISSHTTDLFIKNQVLTLFIDSAPLRHELYVRQEQIIAKANGFFNTSRINKVVVK